MYIDFSFVYIIPHLPDEGLWILSEVLPPSAYLRLHPRRTSPLLQLRAPDLSGQCRTSTSTVNSKLQWPPLNLKLWELDLTVGTARIYVRNCLNICQCLEMRWSGSLEVFFLFASWPWWSSAVSLLSPMWHMGWTKRMPPKSRLAYYTTGPIPLMSSRGSLQESKKISAKLLNQLKGIRGEIKSDVQSGIVPPSLGWIAFAAASQIKKATTDYIQHTKPTVPWSFCLQLHRTLLSGPSCKMIVEVKPTQLRINSFLFLALHGRKKALYETWLRTTAPHQMMVQFEHGQAWWPSTRWRARLLLSSAEALLASLLPRRCRHSMRSWVVQVGAWGGVGFQPAVGGEFSIN